jgi:predicted RNA polymerase sigma factor
VRPEVHGLVALMQLHASRAPTRVDADGEPVFDQDRARWDRGAIAAGLATLARADALASVPGPYHLQAAIAACHATAASVATTDWARIAALYGELATRTPSPIIELNRAMAISRADGPAAGLALVDTLRGERALASYHLLPAARAELLEQLGRRPRPSANSSAPRSSRRTRASGRGYSLARRRAVEFPTSEECCHHAGLHSLRSYAGTPTATLESGCARLLRADVWPAAWSGTRRCRRRCWPRRSRATRSTP